MATLTALYIGLTAVLLASAPAGAQVYKWVDQNGVTNYSNDPPPKSRTGKPATIVEDTISVYTPEKSVTDELERRAKKPSTAPPQPPTVSLPPAPQAARTTTPAPIAYDPCLTSNDRNCQAILYDSSPVFVGRRSAVPLQQPTTTLGPPPPMPQPARAPQPKASFTLKPRDSDPERDSRR